MVSSILLLFTDPDGFFRRDSKEWSDLTVPAAIVLVLGIFSAIIVYLQAPLIQQILPENLRAELGVLSLIGIPLGVVSPFIEWVVFTCIFYVISMIFVGKGTFRQTLAAIGYGFLPTAIGSLIDLIIFWYYLPGIKVTPVKDVLDIQSATLALTHTPVFQITGIIGIIFLMWSANIWIFGLRYARELALRHAMICVGIPVLVFIAFTILSLGVL